MDSDFRAFLDIPDPGVKRVKRRRGYNAFGWTVSLLLLSGAVMASWIGNLYVFNHPENPDCYHFLKKWNKIEPIKRFDLTAAPQGKFFTAKELYDTYLVMSPAELDAKNNELLRNYLRNYSQVTAPVPYLWGRFTTTGVYELSKSDIFPTGMVAVADSVDCPQVRIEHIYPTEYANVPRARLMLAVDPEIRLEKSFSLATVVHVAKLDDDRVLFTVIPINYGQYAYRQGISSTFRLDPPESMNIESGFPVVKPSEMENCMKTFALYRKNRGMLAMGQMLTLPSVPVASPGDSHAAQDIPPEALQPYHPPVADTPPVSTDSETAPNALAANAPMTPLGDELPPAADTETAPQPAPGPQPEAAAPAATSTTAAHPAPANPVSPAPALAKTAPPPSVTASAKPPAATLPKTPAVVKQNKTIAKTAPSVLPSPAPAVRQLAGVQTPPPPAPNTASRAPVASTASAARPKVSDVVASLQSTSKPAVPMVERPVQLESPAPVDYSETVPPAKPASGAKLDPFLQVVPPPVQITQPQSQTTLPARTSSWQTYSPGMMPRGRLITTDQAPQLADLGIGNARLYINGRFVVTATSDGRAVLRPVNLNGSISSSSVRMVVEFPGGARVPMEGAQIARGTLRPFQIVDVRRGSDGQVNIYAREVTVPMSQASPYADRYLRQRIVQQSYNGVD